MEISPMRSVGFDGAWNIRRERQRREDYAARPAAPLRKANDAFATAEALEQLERLRTILERRETYDD